MKAIRIAKPFDLAITDISEPMLQAPGDVKIRVCSGSICGSDIGIYKGANSLATYPRIIGHEYGGTVIETGSAVRNVRPGDLVAVDPVRSCGVCSACLAGHSNVCSSLEVTGVHRDGGFSEFVVSPAANVHAIDPSIIPAELMCLVEPYSIAVQVNHRGRIAKNDSVLVMGAGPIGLSIMQDAKARGARVLASDILDARLDMARKMGADATVNAATTDIRAAVAAFTGEAGMPVVVDAVCSLTSFPLALDLACPAGRVVVLGLLSAPSEVASVAITKKELDVVGSRLSNRRFPEVIESMRNHQYTPECLRSHIFPFKEAQKAFDLILERPEEVIKVVLDFS